MTYYILDFEGEPEPCEDPARWHRWHEANSHLLRVALDKIGKVSVSTVFLTEGNGCPPYLWETMVFGGVKDGHCERYSSRKAAREGHARTVALVKQSME